MVTKIQLRNDMAMLIEWYKPIRNGGVHVKELLLSRGIVTGVLDYWWSAENENSSGESLNIHGVPKKLNFEGIGRLKPSMIFWSIL